MITASSFDFTGKIPPEVHARIEAGKARADANADPKWKHFFDCCVLAASLKKSEITSDDVLEEIEKFPAAPETHNLAAIGPAMSRACDMGILTHTERVKRSERPDKHGNRHNIWLSNYYLASR